MLCKDNVCPENIREHWIKAVEQLLEKRAKRVTMQCIQLHYYINIACTVLLHAYVILFSHAMHVAI